MSNLEIERAYAISLYKGSGGQAAGQLWPYHGLGKLMKRQAEQSKIDADASVGSDLHKVYRRRARRRFSLAACCFERSLAIARKHRDDQGQSHVLESLATLLWSADRKRIGNDNPLATILLEECLHLRHALRDLSSLASAVEVYSTFAHDQENYRLAAELDGISGAIRTIVGIPPYPQARVDQPLRREQTKAKLALTGDSYRKIADDAVEAYRRDGETFLFSLLDSRPRGS